MRCLWGIEHGDQQQCPQSAVSPNGFCVIHETGTTLPGWPSTQVSALMGENQWLVRAKPCKTSSNPLPARMQSPRC